MECFLKIVASGRHIRHNDDVKLHIMKTEFFKLPTLTEINQSTE